LPEFSPSLMPQGGREEAYMANMNKLTVKINGQEYTLTSEESREYMLSVADLVDKKMRQIMQNDMGLSTSRTAMLTALNLADENLRLKHSNDALTKSIVRYTERIKALEDKLHQNHLQ